MSTNNKPSRSLRLSRLTMRHLSSIRAGWDIGGPISRDATNNDPAPDGSAAMGSCKGKSIAYSNCFTC
jgi:hypothetical protein